MKLKTIIAALALLICIPGHARSLLDVVNEKNASDQAAIAAAAADPTNETLAAAAERAAADMTKRTALYNSTLGDDWRDVWANSTLDNPNDELVTRYLAEPFTNLVDGGFPRMSMSAQLSLVAAIAAKPTLTAEDAFAVRYLPYNAALAARVPELAVHLPSGGIRGVEFYTFRNIWILKRKGPLETAMLTPEWIDMAMQPSPIGPKLFIAGREYLMLKVTKSLMDHRAANNLSTEGPEFEAALQPMIDKLKAPRFLGLREATIAAGLDLGVPEVLDWTNLDSVAATVMDAATRKADFLTPWGKSMAYEQGLGSVMLMLGETGYEEWRLQVLGND